jgi:hypothetical protein
LEPSARFSAPVIGDTSERLRFQEEKRDRRVLDLLLLAAQWTAEAQALRKGETAATSAAPQLDPAASFADVSSSTFKLEVSEEVG